jgi:hypothetical protein
MKPYVRSRSAGMSLVDSTRLLFHANRHAICVWLFALVIATLAMFPPWTGKVGRLGDYPARETPLWHAPLWHWPDAPGRFWTVRVDYGRLLIEATAAESLIAALYLTWGKKS